MYAVISSPQFQKDIENAISSLDGHIVFSEVSKDVDISEVLIKASRVNLKCLIIDISSITDKSKIINAVTSFRMKNDSTRIVIIAPDYYPGDKILSTLVSIGVLDIINPELKEFEYESIYEKFIELLQSRPSFSKASKWLAGFNDPENNNLQAFEKSTEAVGRVSETRVTSLIHVPNKLILVVNLSKRAGSTFIALNLAKYLTAYNITPCVIEPPIDAPYIFDYIGLDKRIMEESESEFDDYFSFPHAIADNIPILKDKETHSDNILWLVPDPRQQCIKEWSYDNMLKLLFCSISASIRIIDCGWNFNHDSINKLLPHADLVLAIVDPMPTECMQNSEILYNMLDMKRNGSPIEFLINKWNSGIDKKELLKYLSVEPIGYIPAVDIKYIYHAVYNCKFPIDNKEVLSLLSDPFSSILEIILPHDLIKHNDNQLVNKGSLFNRLLKKKGDK